MGVGGENEENQGGGRRGNKTKKEKLPKISLLVGANFILLVEGGMI